MPSGQVTPKEASMQEDQEMPASVSGQPSRNDVSCVVEIEERENINEELLKEIDEVYSPVLKVMKLFGIYFGYTHLRHAVYTSGRCRKYICLPKIYCAVVVFGLWLTFIMAFVSIFVENDTYLFVKSSLWCIFMALNGTICLIVLPLTDKKKSRFERFLRNVVSVVKGFNSEKVKAKSRSFLVLFCFFCIFAVATVIAMEQLDLEQSPGTAKPWNQWIGFRIVYPIFTIIGAGGWLLPMTFFCITCLILEECFDDLYKIMSSLRSVSMDLAALKIEYHQLCEVVEVADKMLSPLLFEMISLFIPLFCFSFYNAIHVNEGLSLSVYLFWLLVAAGMLAVIFLFGSKVSQKV